MEEKAKKQKLGGELRMYGLILFPSIMMVIVAHMTNPFYKAIGLLVLFALQTLVIKGIIDLVSY